MGFSYSQGMGRLTGKGVINYCRVEWIRRGDTACNSSVCVDFMSQGSYIKAALIFKSFPEKARTRANIIRAGVNSSLSIQINFFQLNYF